MSKSVRGRRWTGWSSRKSSILRPFPNLRCEELEVRDVPATFTWTGLGGDNNWSTAANWIGGSAPTGAPGNQEDLVFGLNPAQTSTNNDLAGAVFNSITIADDNYNIFGNSITLGLPGFAGGTLVVNAGATGNTWAINTALGASAGAFQTFTVAAGSQLNITGNLTGTTGVTLTKDGPGTLQLSADNSGFTGQISIRDNGGYLIISHPNALGDLSNNTVVGTNASLQLAAGVGTINEALVLNGPGVSNNGALDNIGGTNTWAGSISFDGNTTLGAQVNTTLIITSQITDTGSGWSLTKEGSGEVQLNSPTGNAYRGQTFVNDGILTAGSATALGAAGSPSNGTVVSESLTKAGQLRMADPNGIGFTVIGEDLVLNGDGVSPTPDGRATTNRGSFTVTSGTIVWAGPVTLGSPVPNGRDVTVGAAANQNLIIHGVVSSPNAIIGGFNPQLIKVDQGRFVMTNANTYTGFTDIQQGSLTIRDSSSLGAVGAGTRVLNGATLELEVEAAIPSNPQVDPQGRDLGDDSITHDPHRLTISEPLEINGRGFGNTGALRSVSGFNRYLGVITLNSGAAAIGVDADPRTGHPTADFSYFVNDYSLTVGTPLPTLAGGIVGGSGTDFVKRGTGHLILSIANTYTGRTLIEQGWVTIQNNRSLGSDIPNRSVTVQPETIVSAGAAVHLRPFLAGSSLVVPERFTLSGIGMTHSYAFISEKGALMNLDGVNTLTYDITLNGQAGIGVEQVVNPLNSSELTSISTVKNGAAAGGIVKFGSKRLVLQADGTYSGANDVREGTLRIQNDTALGQASSGTATTQQTYTQTDTNVQSGALLETTHTVDYLNGGIETGLQVWNERLILNSPGQQVSVAGSGGTFTLNFNGLTTPSIPITATAAEFYDALVPLVSEVQTIDVTGGTGTFTVTFDGETTLALPFGIAATGGTQPTDSLQNALESLPNMGAVGGIVSVTRTAIAGGFRYTVTFLGSNAALNMNPMSALGSGGATASVATVRNGFGSPMTVTRTGNVFTVIFGDAQAPDVPLLTGVAIGGAELRITGSNAPLINLTDDNSWRGPVTLNSGTRIRAEADSRMSLLGPVSDASNPDLAGSDLVKRGSGSLLLAGNNTYRGTTLIDQGVVTAASNTAFGSTVGGTTVTNGAQLQLQGGLSIAGESLTVQGSGPTTASALTDQWFNVGPAPTNNGQSPSNLPTSGRITSVASDPTDPNVIYISTAGGGSWKTKNGGVTWTQLFDSTIDPSAVMYGGSISVAPSDINTIYFATGEVNGIPNGSPVTGAADNYAGTGVYVSRDAGATWTLLTGPNGENPLYGQGISKLIIDPLDARRIYVASGTRNIVNADVTAVPGVYRFDSSVATPDWVNLTGNASLARETAGLIGAGPEDDFRISYPQSNATWSDILLVASGVNAPGSHPGNRVDYFDAAGNLVNRVTWVLYAALGDSQQSYFTGASQGVFNAVYRTEDPNNPNPIWWLGNGSAYPVAQTSQTPSVPPIATPTVPDARGPGYPVGPIIPPPPTTPQPGRNSWIKLAGVVTNYYNTNMPQPYATLSVNASITVYATNLPNGTDNWVLGIGSNTSGQLVDIQKTGWDGGIATPWTATLTSPVAPFGTTSATSQALGRYNSVLLARDFNWGMVGNNNPNEVYLGGSTQLFRTTDGGTSWAPVLAGANAVYPANNFHALSWDLGTQNLQIGTDGGFYRWDGTNFTNRNGDLIATQFNSVDVHPTDIGRALAAAYNNGLQQFNNNPAWQTTGVNAGDNAGVVRYDPLNPQIAYAAVNGALWKTINGGATWNNIRTVTTGTNSFPLVVDPINPNRIIIGGPVDVFASQSGGAAGSFVSLNSGITVTDLAIAGYQGTFVPDPGFPLVVDRLSNTYDPGTIYVTDGGTLRVTKDNGVSWQTRPPFSNILYTVTFGGSLANQNVPQFQGVGPGGGGPGPGPGAPGVSTATIQQGSPSITEIQTVEVVGSTGFFRLRIGGGFGGGGFGPAVTTGPIPYGATAQVVQDAINSMPGFVLAGGTRSVTVVSGPGSTAITSITVDPSNRDTVYATIRNTRGNPSSAVFRSTDAGQTWDDISGDLPATQTWTTVIDPRTDTLYLGNDQGVWKLPNASTNTTLTWSRFGDGMPVVQVHELVLNQTLNTLTAATYGRGVWQLFLTNEEANSGAIRAISGSSVWTGPVTLTGNTTISADGTQNIQNGIAAASLNIVGTISDSTPGNNSVITKTGPGTVTFSGANTYGGQTLVREGVLQVNNKNALGDPTTGDTIVIPTSINGRPALAALELRSDLEAEPVTINGNGYLFNGHFTGALRSIANDNTYTGLLTFGTNTTIGVDSNSVLTIGSKPGLVGNGSITDGTDNFSFDKELPGTLVLGNVNTYDGLTRVVQGALRVQNNTALGTPGTGTIVLDGAQLQMAGDVTVSGESLSLSGTGINNTGALRNISGNNTYQGSITFTNAPNFAPATNPGSQVAIGVDVLGDNLTIDTSIAQNSAAAQFGLIKVGAGRLTLARANNYAGVTNINGGTIRIQNNAALGPVVSSEVQRISVVGTTGTFQLVFNGQSTVPINANAASPAAFAAAVQNALANLSTIGFTGGIPNVLVSATQSVTGYVLTVTFRGSLQNANQSQLLAANVPAGLQVTISTDQDGGLGTVVGAGAGLELDNTLAALNPTELLALNGDGVAGAGALNNAIGNNTYSGTITLSSSASIGAESGTTLLVNGALQDPMPLPVPAPRLRKAGDGTVIFPAAEQYSGRTVIDAGVLRITNPLALGTGRNEVQTISVYATSGQFTLTFNGQTTPALAVGLPAAGGVLPTDSVQNALNSLGTIGGVGGAVTVTAVTVAGGTVYTVTFGGTLASQNVPQILTQTSVGSVVVGTTTNGSGSEIQTLDVTGGAGTFTITFNGQTTVPLAFDVLASGGVFASDSVQNALNALANIGGIGGSVSVYKTPITGGTRYTITFGGALANTNVNQITAAGVSGAVATPATFQNGAGNANEVQTARVTSSSGTFTLTFDGQTTVPVAFNVPASGGTLPTDSLQNALNALYTVRHSEIQTVQVNGAAGTFTLTFNGQTTVPLAFNVPAIGGLLPADSVQNALHALSSVRRSEIQTLQTTGSTGSFTLTFNGQTTAALPANIPASGGVGPTASLQNALNNLLSIGGIGGSVTVTSTGGPGALTYTITFGGTLANTNVASLVSTPTGGLVTNVAVTQDGLAGTVDVTSTVVAGGTRYTLTFSGDLANTNLPQTTATGSGGATTVVRTVQDGLAGSVTVTSAAVLGGTLYTITFGGALANTNLPQITAPLITSTTIQDGIGPEVQNVQVTGSSGTFTLTFNGQTTTPLPFNSPAAHVETALNALSSIGRAEIQNVQVLGIGGTFTMTFNGQTTTPLAFDATAAEVQNALNALTSVRRSEIQTVTITGVPGTFTLTFNGQTTVPLAYNATAAQVQAALNALSSFGTIGGTANVSAVPVAGGTQYTINFGATLANNDQPQITATTTGAISAVVATVQQGLGGITAVTAAPISGGNLYTVTFGGSLGNSDQPLISAAGFGGAAATVIPVRDGGGAGTATVTRSTIAGGYIYTVTFGGTLANANLPPIVIATLGGNSGLVTTAQNGPEGTTVSSGGTLQVSGGLTMTNEVVTINGPGFNGQGALSSAGGSNIWSTPLYLGSDASIGTATVADSLTFTSPIVDSVPANPSPFNLEVVGPGTVVYAGTVDNQYFGTTTVLNGTLLLNQASGQAIVGPLVIGIGPDPAVVREVLSNQIADDVAVTVDFNGTFDLAGNTDTIGMLTVRSGQVFTGPGGVLTPTGISMTAGTITIGPGGRLVMNGNLFATSTGVNPARITSAGNLDINGTDRAFTIGEGPNVNDLEISSGVVATGGGRLVKIGAGRLTFSPTTPVTVPVASQLGDVRVLTAIGPVELTGGSLSGSGTVSQITGAGGTGPGVGRVEPGVDGAGILSSSGPVTWSPTLRFFVNLDATNHPIPLVGTDYDQFRMTGTGNLNINGAILDGTIGAGVQIIDQFTIINVTGSGQVVGRFAEPFGPGIVFIQNQKFTVDYTDPKKVVLTRVLASVGMSLASSANPSATGQAVTFTATMVPEPGAGPLPAGTTVTFTLDSTSSPPIPVDASGQASWTPPVVLLTNGTHTVTALFSGDSQFFGSQTATLTPPQVVNSIVIDPITLAPSSPTVNVPFISPSITPGIQDAINISTTVRGQLSPLTWTVTIRQGATTVRTYTGNSGPIAGTDYPINVTWDGRNNLNAFVADGIYSITASFVDANSNTATTPAVTVRVDNSPPVPSVVTSSQTIIAPGSNGLVPLTTQLTGSISDANLESWTLTIRDNVGVVRRTFTGTSTVVNEIWDGRDSSNAIVPDGTYTFSLTAIDRAGNPSTVPGTGSIVVLANGPTVQLTTNGPTIYGQSITLTAVVSVPIPAIAGQLIGDTVEFYQVGNPTPIGSSAIAFNGSQYIASITITSSNFNVGSYFFTATYLDTPEFLASTSAAANHSVSRATLTVRADAKTKVYGDPVPALTYSVTGLQYADTEATVLAGSLSTAPLVTQATPVGVSTITQGNLTLTSNNYTLVYASALMTITKAPLTVTAVSQTKTYGDPVSPLTYTVTGLVNGDSQAAVLAGALGTSPVYSQSSPVGNYSITQGNLIASANYDLTYVPGTITVNRAPLTIFVNDASRPFNSPNPTFTAATPYTGLRLNDTSAVVSNLNLTTSVPANAAPGTYPDAIVSSTTPTAQNYDITVVPGDLTITALPSDVAFGSGAGAPARVNVYTPQGNFRTTIFPSDPSYSDRTGIRVAAGDFNGDGVTDVVLGTGPGSPSLVTVVDGKNKSVLFRVNPFESSFVGGVFVAAGDIDADGRPELIITPDEGGGPRVQVYRGTDFKKIADFLGIDDSNFRGGARAAVGDVTGDGFGDVVVAAGFGGGPRVSIYDGQELTQQNRLVHPINDFFIFDGPDVQNLRNGAFISAGDINGDGFADLVAGGGPGGGPRIFAVDGKSLIQGGGLNPLASFFAGNSENRGGIRVVAKDFDGDGRADIVTGAGDNAGSEVNWYKGSDVLASASPAPTYTFNAFDDVLNGVFVG